MSRLASSSRCRGGAMVRTWRWMLLLLRSHAALGKCETSCAAWASQSLLDTCNHPLCGSCGAAIGCPRNAMGSPLLPPPSSPRPPPPSLLLPLPLPPSPPLPLPPPPRSSQPSSFPTGGPQQRATAPAQCSQRYGSCLAPPNCCADAHDGCYMRAEILFAMCMPLHSVPCETRQQQQRRAHRRLDAGLAAQVHQAAAATERWLCPSVWEESEEAEKAEEAETAERRY